MTFVSELRQIGLDLSDFGPGPNSDKKGLIRGNQWESDPHSQIHSLLSCHWTIITMKVLLRGFEPPSRTLRGLCVNRYATRV